MPIGIKILPAGIAWAATAAGRSDRARSMSEIVVQTLEGAVRGVRRDGVARFLGVPYAAAPTGSRRFALPVAHAPWSDVRDAVEPGPSAPHSVRPFPGLDVEPLIGAGRRKGDHYLNVNVWTPENLADGRPRPVMVWVHGGGFVLGSNHAAIQDGTAFARSGVVRIAINYRMGVEGFLPIPGAPTNPGLRDILFALRWVQDNAAAFGGDPGNVTSFGESAGAMAIADLMTSPLAKGLFRRAIVESGHGAMVRPIPVARRLVRKVAKLLKVAPDEAGFRSAKAAVHQLTKSLAAEWAPRGVRVKAVAPTCINTPINAFADREGEMYRRRVDGTPMGRLGEPKEIALDHPLPRFRRVEPDDGKHASAQDETAAAPAEAEASAEPVSDPDTSSPPVSARNRCRTCRWRSARSPATRSKAGASPRCARRRC